MDKSERQKVTDIQSDIWYFLKSKGEIEVPNLYKELETIGQETSGVEETIETLKELSIIEENSESSNPHIKINRLLTAKIRSLPCLGCQSLEKCGVGENYSPENCKKLDFWIKDVTSHNSNQSTESSA